MTNAKTFRTAITCCVFIVAFVSFAVYVKWYPPQTTQAVGTESRFGIHLGSWGYEQAADHINELGEQLFVRMGPPNDQFGWKEVRNNPTSIGICNSCCDSSRSSCNCAVGDFYYCSPLSRAALPGLPATDHPFFGTVISRYDDTPPITSSDLIGDYPYNHEDAYLDYIGYVVSGYQSAVKYWEVGNENDAAMFWAGTPEEYADIVALTAPEIKRLCPDCKVGVSFATPDLAGKTAEQRDQWFDAMGTVCSSFDFVDAHYFAVIFIADGTLDTWNQTCPGKEFITTETGVPDTIIDERRPQIGGSLEAQARDLVKYNTLLFAAGYTTIYWYLVDTDYGTGEVFLYNALINEDGTVKPAFSSYKNMIEKVDYFTSVTKLSDGQYRYTFSDRNPVYVLWCDTTPCSLSSEVSGRLSVTDHQGNATETDATLLSLSENPIFVELLPPLPPPPPPPDTTPPGAITDLRAE